MKEDKEDFAEHFDCQCSSCEHTIRFMYMGAFKDDEPSLWLDIFLEQHRRFFKRVWVAIKYVFGYKCRYGHFGNWLFKLEDAQRLRAMVDRYEKEMEEFKKTQEAG